MALAAALKADECQIYTDVDGVYTTDPRVVDNARRLDSITFEEMLEMASQGSKVLQIRAVEFAGKYNVPLRVLSSFQDGPGTLISVEDEVDMEKPVISGIAFTRDEAKIIVRGAPDTPGIAYKILGPVSAENIEVDMIVQNVGKTALPTLPSLCTATISPAPRKPCVTRLKSWVTRKLSVTTRSQRSLVGVGMRSHAGVASKMFEALANEGVNIEMISTSEIKVSVVIAEKYLELAVRALHSEFELDQPGT